MPWRAGFAAATWQCPTTEQCPGPCHGSSSVPFLICREHFMAMLQVGVSLMYGAPGSFTVECKHSVWWYTMVHLDRSFQHQLAQLYNKLVQMSKCCVACVRQKPFIVAWSKMQQTLLFCNVFDTDASSQEQNWPQTKFPCFGAPFGCRNSFPTPGPLLRVALFAHKVLGQRPPKHEGAASPWATKDVHDTICIGSTMLPYLGFYDRNNLLSLTTLQYSIWSRVVLPTSSWTICYPEFAERLQEKLEEMATEAFQTAVALATRGPGNWDGRVSPPMDL